MNKETHLTIHYRYGIMLTRN